MNSIKQRLADALVQAAMEGDDSAKVTVSLRVLEIMAVGKPPVFDFTGSTLLGTAPSAPVGQIYTSVQGDTLREALRAPLRSQSELARRLGLHPSAINKVCSGKRDISASEAEVIQAYLTETAVPEAPLAVESSASKIRDRLTALGLSARDASLKAGLGPDGVRTILNGHKPSAEKLKALAGVLGVDMDELL